MKICRILAAATLAALVVLPVPALAQCMPVLAAPDQLVSLVAEGRPGAGTIARTLSVEIRNEGSDACEIDLAIGVDIGRSDIVFPELKISANGQPIDFDPAITGSRRGALSLEIAPGEARYLDIVMSLPYEWSLEQGNYERTFVLSMFEPAQIDPTAQRDIMVALDVAPATQIQFVGSTEKLEFGVLSLDAPNQSPPFGVRVFSNTSYLVQVESQNQGRMIRQGGGDWLDYSLWIDGSEVQLGATPARVAPKAVRGNLGSVRTILARTPSAAGKLAGDYTDRVTLTVTPL